MALSATSAWIGMTGFDGHTPIEALRLDSPQQAARALPRATPALPVGQKEFAAEVSWDPPNRTSGATSLLDVTMPGPRHGDMARAALASSTRLFEIEAAALSGNAVRVMVRHVPPATFGLGAAMLSVSTTKRRVP